MLKKTRRSIIDVELKKAPTHNRTAKSYHILPKGTSEAAKTLKGARSPSSKQDKSKKSPMRSKGMLSPKHNTMPSPPISRRFVKKLSKKQKSKPPVRRKSAKSPRSSKPKHLSNQPSKPLKAPPSVKKIASPKGLAAKPPRIAKKKSSSVIITDCPPNLKERLHILQERVSTTKALLKTTDTEQDNAARVIQRWFRRLLSKGEQSESWEDLFQHDLVQSELVEQFRKALNDRHLQIDKIFEKNEEMVKAQIHEFENHSSNRSSERFVLVNTQKIPKLKLNNIHGDESVSSIYIDDDISDIEMSSITIDEETHQESDSVLSSEPGGFVKGIPQLSIAVLGDLQEPVPCKLQIKSKNPTSCKTGSLEEDIEMVVKSELLNFFQVIQFVYKELDVNPSMHFIEQCEDFLIGEIRKNSTEIMDTLTSPIYNDPFDKLLILQNTGIGELLKLPSFELILETVYLEKLQKAFNPGNNSLRSLYIQMIYDSFNEALNHARPYGTQGNPYPWSSKSVLLLSDKSLEEAMESTKGLMHTWGSVRSGPILIEESDRLNSMIVLDIQNSETAWTDYEDEESQLTFDISDLVVEEITINMNEGILVQKAKYDNAPDCPSSSECEDLHPAKLIKSLDLCYDEFPDEKPKIELPDRKTQQMLKKTAYKDTVNERLASLQKETETINKKLDSLVCQLNLKERENLSLKLTLSQLKENAKEAEGIGCGKNCLIY